MTIDEILVLASKSGVSDVHLTIGRPPVFRLHGALLSLDSPEWQSKLQIHPEEIRVLTPEDTEILAQQVMSLEQYKKFNQTKELDLAYSLPGIGRFRVNVVATKLKSPNADAIA